MVIRNGAKHMGLTAREWLLLPREDQDVRGPELSPEECRKLRMELSEIHFSEEEKQSMSEEEKYKFTHPRQLTEEEILNNKKSSFHVMRDLFGLLPKELTFEEWNEKGCPLNWKE